MFDRIVMLDWSAAKGRKTGADSIWAGDGQGDPVNIPTRTQAETHLTRDLQRPGRVLLGVDIGFGWPQGLARAVAGQPKALAMWDWLESRVRDDAQGTSTYRLAAAEANRAFGQGPFWGDGTKAGTPGLPRLKPALPPGLAPLRQTETAAAAHGPRPKSMFQLAGVGAVGAQALTCLPMLARLRRRFPDLAVWPLEPIETARIVLAEVYFSMLGPVGEGFPCRDAAQVHLMAQTVGKTGAQRLMQTDAPAEILTEEGWILGCTQAGLIRATLQNPKV